MWGGGEEEIGWEGRRKKRTVGMCTAVRNKATVTHHHRGRKEKELLCFCFFFFFFFSGEGKENVQLENNNIFTKQSTQKRERKYLFGCGNAVLRAAISSAGKYRNNCCSASLYPTLFPTQVTHPLALFFDR